MIQLPLSQRIILGLAATTAFGVLVHDTKLDQAASLAIALPVATATIVGAAGIMRDGMDHTHVERASFDRSTSAVPRVRPRDDNRRYLLTRHMKGLTLPEGNTLLLLGAAD